MIYTAYTAGALLTAAMIHNANRASGTPWLYTVSAAALWPLWWLGFGVDTY